MDEETKVVYGQLMDHGVDTKEWEVILRSDPYVRGCYLIICIKLDRKESQAFLVYTDDHHSGRGIEEVDVKESLNHFPHEVKEMMNDRQKEGKIIN